jgi:hypothetical protein
MNTRDNRTMEASDLFQNSVVTRAVAMMGLAAAMAQSSVAAQPETLELTFSVPGQDEAGVSLAAPVRLQLSAHLDASTLQTARSPSAPPGPGNASVRCG